MNLILIMCILLSYVLTFILVKIGFKLDKENQAYPAPNFIFILMFIPFMNIMVGLAGLCIIIVFTYKFSVFEKLQNKIFGERKE